MSHTASDKAFVGSIPEVYERLLVPLIFQPYADDLAERLAARRSSDVLEIAAGTGVVTRAMAKRLPAEVSIVATDLNEPMLASARKAGTARPVEWRTADAMKLPLADGSFDAVVCQFGVMFFPDRPAAYAEARRVLRPGGVFLFNVWDRIEVNEFAEVAEGALAEIFPKDAPRFMRRTPHGYSDTARIREDLVKGGFESEAVIETLSKRSRAKSPRDPAIAYCQGTPLRNEIEARDASALESATEVAARAIAGRFGSGAVDGLIQAHVVAVER